MRSERTTRRCRSGDVNRAEGAVRKKIIGENNLSPPPRKRCAHSSPLFVLAGGSVFMLAGGIIRKLCA